MARRGFESASAFSLLEHADDDGRVARPAAKHRPGAAAGRLQQPAQQGGGAGQQQQAQAEDYYRAFMHVYRDPTSGETVLRFHKTNIIRIRPNGDMMLQTGGWCTATTVSALNDGLHALDMAVQFEAPVSAGKWIVIDDLGQRYQFKDCMVIKATTAQHKARGATLLKAYNGGADVPRYARKPVPGSARPLAAAAAAARPNAAAAAATQQQQWPAAVNYQAAAMAGAGPRPAAADIHQQLAAAMQRMGMDEDEMVADDHLCVVCLEHARDEVLVPCGHMVLCHGCCAKIMSSDTNECPMCRETIIDHCIIDPEV